MPLALLLNIVRSGEKTGHQLHTYKDKLYLDAESFDPKGATLAYSDDKHFAEFGPFIVTNLS